MHYDFLLFDIFSETPCREALRLSQSCKKDMRYIDISLSLKWASWIVSSRYNTISVQYPQTHDTIQNIWRHITAQYHSSKEIHPTPKFHSTLEPSSDFLIAQDLRRTSYFSGPRASLPRVGQAHAPGQQVDADRSRLTLLLAVDRCATFEVGLHPMLVWRD